MITESYNRQLTMKYECIKCKKVYSPLYIEYIGKKFKCTCGCEIVKEKTSES